MQGKADVNMIAFGGVNCIMYWSRESINLQEIKEKLKAVKNGKSACLGEFTGEMIKRECYCVILCTRAF